MTPRRWLVVALSFAVVLGISGYIVWRGWAREGTIPVLPLWAHGLAIGVVLAEVLTRGLKISLSAASLRIPLKLSTAIRTILGGDFAAAITPGRSGAEPARFLVLAEAGVPAASIVLILFTEIFLEMLSLIIVVAALWFMFQNSGSILVIMLGVIGAYAAFVIGVGIFGYYLAHRNAHGPPPHWARRIGLHAGRWRRIQRMLRSLRASIAALRTARIGPMVAATLASAIHVFLRLTVMVIVVQAIEPVVDPAPLILWSIVLLYGSTLAPAPGGGGAVEFSFKLALGGLLAADVLAGSLIWWRFYSFYVYIVLGALAAGSTVLRALGERPDEIIAEARP